MAARGHFVTVLCARHDRRLPARSVEQGVTVVRLWAPLRISRGMLMPTYPLRLWRELRNCDVVNVHTPMLETALIGVMARVRGVGLTITHHGDLVLPPGRLDRTIECLVLALHKAGARAASATVAYSAGYRDHSLYIDSTSPKVCVIAPPVSIPPPDQRAARSWRLRLAPDGGPLLLFAGRFVREKRPDLAIEALAIVRQHHPQARLVFVGEHQIAYESTWEQQQDLVRRYESALTFLGLIDDVQNLADLYAAADALVLTSDTECFGMVQAEAMLSGTPVVMTDIPGGRVPVRESGMGRLATPGDAASIAEALLEVLANRALYVIEREEVVSRLGLDRTMDRYEEVLRAAAR
jgi:glycosyltransferase involved in cell wall biosynthesis